MPWVFFFQHRLKLDPALSQVVFIRAVVSGFQLMTIIYQYIVLYGCIVWIIIYTYIPLFPACRFFFFANEKRIWLIFTNGRKWNFRVLNTHTYIQSLAISTTTVVLALKQRIYKKGLERLSNNNMCKYFDDSLLFSFLIKHSSCQLLSVVNKQTMLWWHLV